MIKKFKHFITKEVWSISLHGKSKSYSFLISQVRIIVLAVKGFIENRVSLRASALTFYTLLSIVPIAAMAFGIAKGFGFENKMEELIIENFKGQEEVMNWIIKFSYSILEDVKGGLLAGIGMVILLWSVMQVMSNIELSFNAIWEVKKSRTFFRKLSDYLAIMMFAPILLLVSSSLSVYVSTRIETVTSNLEFLGPYFQFMITLIPYAIVWLVFTLIYMIMPNTKVNFKYALIAGILAGTLFQIVQWGYINFQFGVSRYNAIYGTFAALPLFLIWLEISWIIVLLGAEISFAYQNIGKYEFETQALNISNHDKRIVSLLLSHYIIKKFVSGAVPATSTEISQELGIPLRLIRDTLYNLIQARIIIETSTENTKEMGYLPAIDIAKIDIHFVLDKIDDLGTSNLTVKETKEYLKFSKIYDSLLKNYKKSEWNILIKDI